jgi:UDP-N-acetyl-2-amino-2-deoxyglucuronate dehydrogenase
MRDKSGLGFGIVGCGMIGHFHAKAIQAMQGGHLEACFDLRAEAADKLAAEYGLKAYSNFDAFLAHPGLDVVTVGTPSGTHAETAVKAANAKKHVICEKPVEITLEKIDSMIEAAKKNGVILAGVHQRRFFPSVQEFKKAIDSGRLGKITLADAYMKWYRTQAYYDQGGWRGTWKLDGGGALMNQAIHTIDQLYYLMGDVESVCAFAKLAAHERIEVEDVAVAILRFKNGAMGVIEGTTTAFSNTGHAAEVHVSGDAGSVFMKDKSISVWDFKNPLPGDAEILQKYGAKEGAAGVGAADPKAINFEDHQNVFEDAVKAIREKRQPAINGEQGRKSVEIILAIYESALQGGKMVSLPLKKTPDLKAFN